MAKYGKTAQSEVKKAMDEMKHGELRNGKSEKRVTSKKQAIAIGLSKARKKGGKVPTKAAKS
jgi:predicted SPOUT superfamily RNA methylase MTH1